MWATVGSTAEWPEVRVQWEMDDWDHFAACASGPVPDGRARRVPRRVCGTRRWSTGAADTRCCLRPASFSPDVATIVADDITGDVILHEDVRSLPGRMGDYHAALQSEYLPLAEARGLRLLGAYEHALMPEHRPQPLGAARLGPLAELMESEPDDAELRAWTDRQGEWLADIDGFLVASPPSGALRT